MDECIKSELETFVDGRDYNEGSTLKDFLTLSSMAKREDIVTAIKIHAPSLPPSSFLFSPLSLPHSPSSIDWMLNKKELIESIEVGKELLQVLKK